MRVVLSGRTDLEDFFRLSGVLSSEFLNHTPLLVFVCSGDTVEVKIIHKPLEILSFPDETPVMAQWTGNYRSDFFQFTVGDARKVLDAKNELLKHAKNVIKYIGPMGGFRSLSYQYVGDDGIPRHCNTGLRSEADRLESFFIEQGIPIVVKKLDRK